MSRRLPRITPASVIVVLAILTAATWASVLQDGGGNSISTDVVAPGGGGRIVSGHGAVLNSCIGQTAVGLSLTTTDVRLSSGVLAPQGVASPPAVWVVY